VFYMDFKTFRCVWLDLCEEFDEYPTDESRDKEGKKTHTQEI